MREFLVRAHFLDQRENRSLACFARCGLAPIQLNSRAACLGCLHRFSDIEKVRLDTGEDNFVILVAVEQFSQLVEQHFDPRLQASLFVTGQLASGGGKLTIDQELRIDRKGIVDDFNSIHVWQASFVCVARAFPPCGSR
ncbi:MAG: hypothetical protein ACTHN9_20730 [Trinickia sp.]